MFQLIKNKTFSFVLQESTSRSQLKFGLMDRIISCSPGPYSIRLSLFNIQLIGMSTSLHTYENHYLLVVNFTRLRWEIFVVFLKNLVSNWVINYFLCTRWVSSHSTCAQVTIYIRLAGSRSRSRLAGSSYNNYTPRTKSSTFPNAC